jgi:bifunctional NMN adenylyltransferase/nudix hydrolase
MKIHVIVGRFQVPNLSAGHQSLISQASENADMLVILLGTPHFRTDRNPLSFQQRAAMIRVSLSTVAHRVGIYPIMDNISDEVWSRNLDDFLKRTHPNSEFTLFHGRDSFAPYYKGSLPLVEVKTAESASGTQLRAECGKTPPIDSTAYRSGYIAALEHQRPSTATAVDIIVKWQHPNGTGNYFLLVRKPDEDKWRFPGGMVDPGETAEDASRRELKEETGLLTKSLSLIGTAVCADWRMRGSKHGVLSVIFLTEYNRQDGLQTPKAGDDVVSWQWVKSYEVFSLVIPEHAKFFHRFSSEGKIA